MFISVNGKIVHHNNASISPFDHGYLYGMGLFETFRVYKNHPFLFDDHIDRLMTGMGTLGIRSQNKRKQWLSLVSDLLQANQLEDAYIRLNVSAGVGELGLRAEPYDQPTEMIFVKPLPRNHVFAAKRGLILTILRNTPETSQRLKSHHFMNNILAKQEIGSDADKEGIFLTAKGEIAEGIVSNLFWIKDGTAYTPVVETGILNGVTRRFVIKLLNRLRIPCQEGFYKPEHLFSAEEVFMTNSIQEITPFFDIEGTHFPGNNGEITRKLQKEYKAYREWLWTVNQLD